MFDNLFTQRLFDPASRFEYLAWVLTAVISVVLHELAHGWMAIRCGDDTPIREGRMTGNPLVHMGPFSLVALFVFGFAWGMMPIDPSRLRGKYAEAKVAIAGPLVNLTLAALCAVGFAIAVRVSGLELVADEPSIAQNVQTLLVYAGMGNAMLFVFNLLPVPPLDGSHILANFHRGYERFISNPANHGMFMLMFIGAFAFGGVLLTPVMVAYMHVCVRLAVLVMTFT